MKKKKSILNVHLVLAKFLWQQMNTLEYNIENVVLSITDLLLMLKSRDTLVNLTRKVCLPLTV